MPRHDENNQEEPMPTPVTAVKAIAAVKSAPGTRVKLAVSDIDGVLRGKYVHKEKFYSAVDGGFGFCDVVFGWDMMDACYDNTTLTGWHKGFPDATAKIDLGTMRTVPWDGDVPFFLADFVTTTGGKEAPLPICPRQVLKRVLERARKLSLLPMCGMEYEWFNFRETPYTWADKQGVAPTPLTPGMFGYSLLRAGENRSYFEALMSEMAAFGVPIEGLHTETGPGVYEAAIMFSEALEQADRAILFKLGAKEIGARFGIMPSFMAKWSKDYPGCSGHIHTSLSDGTKNLFYEPKRRNAMSRLFESFLAGQLSVLLEFAPMFWPTINSYKRLVDGFWAPVKPTWGIDNRTASFRVIPGSPKTTRLETRCPGADINPYLAMAAVIAAGLAGVEKKMKLTTAPIRGTNVGAENVPRAPRTLIETTRIFRASDAARDWFGDDFVDHFAATREWEWRQWLDAVTDWERKRYFEII
jgi:glutamine synthetase